MPPYTAGALDIRYAHLALALSDNSEVRAFAETMIRDHTAVNQAAGRLVAELDVTPRDNALSRALDQTAAARRTELASLARPGFRLRLRGERSWGYHQLVNETVAESFIPNVTVEPLKALLEDALVTFRAHEAHAESMVAGLACAG